MLIKVKVEPGSKVEEFREEAPESFVISVREKAEKGRANKRVLELLRIRFPARPIKMLAGGTSSHKIFEVGE